MRCGSTLLFSFLLPDLFWEVFFFSILSYFGLRKWGTESVTSGSEGPNLLTIMSGGDEGLAPIHEDEGEADQATLDAAAAPADADTQVNQNSHQSKETEPE